MSATSYSDLFLFLLLKVFDVYQVMPGEVPLHTSACPLGLAWASPGSPRGCSCPSRPRDRTALGGKQAGQGPLAALVLAEKGFPPAGVHGVRTIPIALKIILLFSTYLQSAVQTLFNDSVIARGKSWQREG